MWIGSYKLERNVRAPEPINEEEEGYKIRRHIKEKHTK